MIQTPSIQPDVCTARATSDGTRKMPEPMIVPTTRLMVSKRLRLSGKLGPVGRESPSWLTRTPCRWGCSIRSDARAAG